MPWAIPDEGRGHLLSEKVHLKKRYLIWKVTSMKEHHCNLTGGKSAQQPPMSCTFDLWVKSCPGDVQSSHWLHNGKCITYLELTWLYLEWFNTLVIKSFVVWRSNINRWPMLFFASLFCTFWQVSARGRTQCVLVREALPGPNPGPWAQCEQPGMQLEFSFIQLVLAWSCLGLSKCV